MIKNKKAFTIIELLLVFLIIGTIVSISVPYFKGLIDDTREKEAKADLRMIKSALEMYRINNGNYPSEDTWITDLTSETSRMVDSIPDDAFRTEGNKYTYVLNEVDGSYFVAYSYGADGQEGTMTVGTDTLTVSGAGVDNVWVTNCKTVA
jgi:general secretion pathway protein G